MITNLSNIYRSGEVGDQKIHPLQDGILAALGVFVCFAVSAWWIHSQAWKTQVAHNKETVKMIAWRAGEKLDPTVLIVEPQDAEIVREVMESDRERCLAAGMDDYLSKPIRSDALGAMLERYGLVDGEGPASRNSMQDFDRPGRG